MYAWARRQELVANKPTDDIDTASPPSRERVLSLDELARVWRAADELDPIYREVVHLMILTGQRRAEVAGMTWGELQLGAKLWILPPARTKARRQHVLPLAPVALGILQARHAAYRHEPAARALVLPTLARDGKSEAPISGWNSLKRALDRKSGVGEWRLHDFRRSIVTHCAEHGAADVATLDSLLNHSSSATRSGVIGTYQRAQLIQPMRQALEQWEQMLTQALSGPADDNVVPLPATRLRATGR
jgi:integrase